MTYNIVTLGSETYYIVTLGSVTYYIVTLGSFTHYCKAWKLHPLTDRVRGVTQIVVTRRLIFSLSVCCSESYGQGGTKLRAKRENTPSLPVQRYRFR